MTTTPYYDRHHWSDRLYFEIGGYFGHCYRIRLFKGKLAYRQADGAYYYGAPTQLTPSAGQWETFWQAVDAAGTWNWAPRYWTEICDGIQWSVILRHHGRIMRSHGSNAYPGSDTPDYGRRSSFGRFVHAIQILTGNPEIA